MLVFGFFFSFFQPNRSERPLQFTENPDLNGLPRNGVQVVVAEVQLLQSQEVVERSLVDQHQLVVVQDEVVELGHAAERVVAYPRQPVTKDNAETLIIQRQQPSAATHINTTRRRSSGPKNRELHERHELKRPDLVEEPLFYNL